MRRRYLPLLGLGSTASLLATLLLFSPAARVEAVEPNRDVAAQPAGLPADLALVPADAVGFVHVRIADLWKDEMASGFRSTWEAAGPKAITALDKMFVPAPSSISRATAFALLEPESKEPLPFAIFAFDVPFDPVQVVRVNLPETNSRVIAGKVVYSTPQMPQIGVYFPDKNHIVIGLEPGFDIYLGKPIASEGPLASALKLAATKPVVAALNIAALPLPPGLLNDVPPEVLPILKAQQVVASLELGAEPRIDVRAIYSDEASAQEAEKATRSLLELGRKELGKLKTEFENKLFDPNAKNPRPIFELPETMAMVFGIGSLNRLDGLLADPKLVTRKGTELTGSLPVPRELINAVGGYAGIGLAFLLPAIQKVREAAARATSSNNLKQIAIAIHNYHDVNNQFPRDITDKTGKPILSWRVAILPYIEQDNLYKQFRMDEPWDGPNNKKLSQTLIKTFISPSETQHFSPDGFALTSYKGVAGPGTFFDAKVPKMSFGQVTDGLSNTVMIIDAGDPIPWAKPGDYMFDPDKPLPKLFSPGSTTIFQAAMGDGSVRAVNSKTVHEKNLKAAFTRAGGETLGLDW